MTKAQQRIVSLKWKKRAEKRFRTMIRPWTVEISAEYRIGNSDINESLIMELFTILRRFQALTFKDIIGADLREYKQINFETDDLVEYTRRAIAQAIADIQAGHNTTSVRSIIETIKKIVRRVSDLAIFEAWTEKEATRALQNYLNGHMIIVSTTESQWIVEATRRAAVVSINEPIKDAIQEIANLFRSGQNYKARKLAMEVERLARLPLSEGQGEVISQVSISQNELIGAEAQARALANAQERADELGKDKQTWEAVFIRTREPHAEADGQEQDIDKPFIVGGELLMHPGDGGLGASLWNIINCQCYVGY